MGSDVHVIVVGGSLALLDVARRYVEELERRWSRFLPDSEVTRINERAGRAVRVSADTVELVRTAIEGARRTAGRFDPTVLGSMLRAGYDRSFERLDRGSPAGRSPLRNGVEGIDVDPGASTVALPRGVGFDPGGIGKGLAADKLVAVLLAGGARGASANIGGDLRVRGDSPGGEAWVVAIEHPTRSGPAVVVALRDGAVATTTRARRTWGPPREGRHHLIDPATGRPAWTGLLSATAIAAEGWQAEVAAKAAFVGGAADGLSALEGLGAEGLLIDDRGRVLRTTGLEAFRAGRRAQAVAG
jgi:thiamine biosynthesis lipoprotein